MSELKSELRKTLMARRRAIDPAQRTAATRRAMRQIERLPQFKHGSRVAIYQAFGSELDPRRLILSAQRRGVKLYVPKVIDLRRRRMLFVPIDPRDSHRGHAGRLKFRPRTPTPTALGGTHHCAAVSARWLDMIVIPIVGIDSVGRRLGMGAGFFDRVLAYRRLRRCWRGPLLVGIGFDCQRAASIGAESWDARLDALVTEFGIEHFTAR
jgi:5-formyltetrahydrofolate cyclo-ligase